MAKQTILFIMGVSGSGKSTIGKLLAERLNYPFYDGDDYHSADNIKKMAAAIPLNDNDRKGWLQTLNELAKANCREGAVITCSALKVDYRHVLSKGLEEVSTFVYLEGTFEEIFNRLQQRKDHFMPPMLLKSQFEALEPPLNAIRVSINLSPTEIVSKVLTQLNTN